MAKWNKELAKELIMAGDLNNAEIARRVGEGCDRKRIAYLRSTMKDAPPTPLQNHRDRSEDDETRRLIVAGEYTNSEIATMVGNGATTATIRGLRRRIPGAPPSPVRVVERNWDVDEARRLIETREMYDHQIGLAIGADHRDIGKLRRSMGLGPLPYRKPRKADPEDVQRLSAQKVSASRQARILGVSARTIQRNREQLGLSDSTPRDIAPERRALAESMLNDHAPYAEVHRTTGISLSYLYRNFPGKGWTAAETARYRHTLEAARKAGIDL